MKLSQDYVASVRVGVVGCGRMGRALGLASARAGHEVVFGSRRPEAAARAARDAGRGALPGTRSEAVAHARLVLLATRWQETFHALAGAGSFAGRVVLDATNPSTPDGLELVLGHVTSGAEEIARAVPRARVVKAFNHVYAEVVEAGRRFGGLPATVFYCGDDPEAVGLVAAFIESLGFDAEFAGPLRSARWLEPLAQLAVELVEGRGRAPGSAAFGLLRAGSEPDAAAGLAGRVSAEA